eukprot:TRINITY_DN11190_c0_g1_i3.p1 TRINITY_DN11190_c0_g1~~TRINITY_DN11190_c0_g1_i3.p1  ORF type:complete len:1081 (+),score=128.62 TRINITY_DN11190_c0_g1_i3:700-3942(+)
MEHTGPVHVRIKPVKALKQDFVLVGLCAEAKPFEKLHECEFDSLAALKKGLCDAKCTQWLTFTKQTCSSSKSDCQALELLLNSTAILRVAAVKGRPFKNSRSRTMVTDKSLCYAPSDLRDELKLSQLSNLGVEVQVMNDVVDEESEAKAVSPMTMVLSSSPLQDQLYQALGQEEASLQAHVRQLCKQEKADALLKQLSATRMDLVEHLAAADRLLGRCADQVSTDTMDKIQRHTLSLIMQGLRNAHGRAPMASRALRVDELKQLLSGAFHACRLHKAVVHSVAKHDLALPRGKRDQPLLHKNQCIVFPEEDCIFATMVYQQLKGPLDIDPDVVEKDASLALALSHSSFVDARDLTESDADPREVRLRVSGRRNKSDKYTKADFDAFVRIGSVPCDICSCAEDEGLAGSNCNDVFLKEAVYGGYTGAVIYHDDNADEHASREQFDVVDLMQGIVINVCPVLRKYLLQCETVPEVGLSYELTNSMRRLFGVGMADPDLELRCSAHAQQFNEHGKTGASRVALFPGQDKGGDKFVRCPIVLHAMLKTNTWAATQVEEIDLTRAANAPVLSLLSSPLDQIVRGRGKTVPRKRSETTKVPRQQYWHKAPLMQQSAGKRVMFNAKFCDKTQTCSQYVKVFPAGATIEPGNVLCADIVRASKQQDDYGVYINPVREILIDVEQQSIAIVTDNLAAKEHGSKQTLRQRLLGNHDLGSRLEVYAGAIEVMIYLDHLKLAHNDWNLGNIVDDTVIDLDTTQRYGAKRRAGAVVPGITVTDELVSARSDLPGFLRTSAMILYDQPEVFVLVTRNDTQELGVPIAVGTETQSIEFCERNMQLGHQIENFLTRIVNSFYSGDRDGRDPELWRRFHAAVTKRAKELAGTSWTPMTKVGLSGCKRRFGSMGAARSFDWRGEISSLNNQPDAWGQQWGEKEAAQASALVVATPMQTPMPKTDRRRTINRGMTSARRNRATSTKHRRHQSKSKRSSAIAKLWTPDKSSKPDGTSYAETTQLFDARAQCDPQAIKQTVAQLLNEIIETVLASTERSIVRNLGPVLALTSSTNIEARDDATGAENEGHAGSMLSVCKQA